MADPNSVHDAEQIARFSLRNKKHARATDVQMRIDNESLFHG
jgi:hypothetical protein